MSHIDVVNGKSVLEALCQQDYSQFKYKGSQSTILVSISVFPGHSFTFLAGVSSTPITTGITSSVMFHSFSRTKSWDFFSNFSVSVESTRVSYGAAKSIT